MTNLISAIQMLSVSEPEVNLSRLRTLLAKLSPMKNQLVLLPEDAITYADKASYQALAEELGNGPVQKQLAALAKVYQCYLICGSFPIKHCQTDKFFTSMLVFSPQGELISYYHKLHLFDALITDQHGSYQESDNFVPGENIALFDWCYDNNRTIKVGLSICYDLRFPGLFQALRAQGAEVIVLAAAFTKVTGEAHWQALLQARAIENQCYIVAANQGGKHLCGRETFGHSMIISPWGEVLSQLEYGEGVIRSQFDKSRIEEVRKAMPVTLHNRFIHSLK